jgi:ketosteroid isomerase-like protein
MTDGPTAPDLERRLRRVEDRFEIQELVARYGFAMDDRDVAALPGLFTADAEVTSQDGSMQAAGRDAVVQMFRRRLEALGPSNHFTHDRLLTFSPDSPDEAEGLVLSHAEMNLRGAAMVTAIRYRDRYRCEDGCWRFRSRALSFMYFVHARDYADALGAGVALRNRVLREPRAGDWPESLATWKDFYGA